MAVLRFLDEILDRLTIWLLVLAIAAMIIMTLGAVVLRQFNMAFLWLEPLVRHLVFVSAFLGGSLATARGQHIGIDLVSRWLEARQQPQLQHAVQLLLSVTTMVVLWFLVLAGWDGVKVELEFNETSAFGVSRAVLAGIIPVGFALIGLRLLRPMADSVLNLCGMKTEA